VPQNLVMTKVTEMPEVMVMTKVMEMTTTAERGDDEGYGDD
jgi:hypothetical protein